MNFAKATLHCFNCDIDCPLATTGICPVDGVQYFSVEKKKVSGAADRETFSLCPDGKDPWIGEKADPIKDIELACEIIKKEKKG